jgi:hypothetical protein
MPSSASPANPEAVFRAAVVKDGVPCADILQVWLDVRSIPLVAGRRQMRLRVGLLVRS